jgi:Ca2+-binding RTX toxin-like protein
MGALRFGGNTATIINDNTAAGSEIYIDYLSLFSTGGNTVTLSNVNITAIRTGQASVNVTTGSGWLGTFLSFDGDDVLHIGSGGADSIRVGHGDNTMTTSTEWVGTILAYSGDDSVVIGSGGAGSIYLGSGDNHVETGSGTVSSISVFDGNDVIALGSGGARSVFTGVGDDLVTISPQTITSRILQINADLGIDRIDFSALTSDLAVSLSTHTATSSEVAAILADFENITGGSGNDMLTGDSSANAINGASGNDIMRGMAGNDTYYVNNAGDIVDESVAGSNGFDRVNSAVSFSLADTTHFMGAIEMGVLLGSGNLNIAGNALNNLLYGNSGNNVVNGAGGNDIMRGMAGNDTYIVANAGDVVDESVTGSNGFDRINSALTINLWDVNDVRGTVEMAVLTGTGNVNASGGAVNNLIIGNAGNNVLNGGFGNDILRGLGGSDPFFFSTALNATHNVDRIDDFSVPADTIRLENNIFTGLAAGVLAANAFHIGAAAADASDRIVYNSTTGALSFDADGNGGTAAIQFAQLATGLGLTNADFAVV